MLQPTERPPLSLAPRLAASMMPGPPPVHHVKPARASSRPPRAPARIPVVFLKRAEPRTVTHGPTKWSAGKPRTNSTKMRAARAAPRRAAGGLEKSPDFGRGTVPQCSWASAREIPSARAVGTQRVYASRAETLCLPCTRILSGLLDSRSRAHTGRGPGVPACASGGAGSRPRRLGEPSHDASNSSPSDFSRIERRAQKRRSSGEGEPRPAC